jgi:DNA-binding transcriptional LysR family regulator
MHEPRLDYLIDITIMLYAKAIFEEQNFTRAATKLHVTQSALSQTVRAWEKRHEIQLFAVDGTGMKPTRACTALLRQAERSLVYARRAYQDAKRAHENYVRQICVGYSPLIDARFLARLRQQKSAATPVYKPASVAEIVAKVTSHEWHAGVVTLPVDHEELIVRRLLREPLVAVLAAEHRLAAERRLALEDLEHQPVILPPRTAFPELYDSLIAQIRHATGTKEPEIIEAEAAHALEMAREGLGVAILPTSAIARRPRGITVVRFRDRSLAIETALITRRENGMAPIKAFVDEVLRLRDDFIERSRHSVQKMPVSA